MPIPAIRCVLCIPSVCPGPHTQGQGSQFKWKKEIAMPALIELTDQDRLLAKRIWRELEGQTTLQQCENAVQIVKECRHHGIDPASILGPGMEIFLDFERANSNQSDQGIPNNHR